MFLGSFLFGETLISVESKYTYILEYNKIKDRCNHFIMYYRGFYCYTEYTLIVCRLIVFKVV